MDSLDDGTTLVQLNAAERIKLEFGTAIRTIAEAAKLDIGIALDLYGSIERNLEVRVYQLMHGVHYQASQTANDYWKPIVHELEDRLNDAVRRIAELEARTPRADAAPTIGQAGEKG